MKYTLFITSYHILLHPVLFFRNFTPLTFFQVPIIFPILFVLCSIFLLIAPILEKPKLEFLYATLFVVGGLIFYFPFVHFKLVKIGEYQNYCLFIFFFFQLFTKLSQALAPPEEKGFENIVWKKEKMMYFLVLPQRFLCNKTNFTI